jgi:hypothetical protein
MRSVISRALLLRGSLEASRFIERRSLQSQGSSGDPARALRPLPPIPDPCAQVMRAGHMVTNVAECALRAHGHQRR